MAAEIENQEVVEQTIQASRDNTDLILDRVKVSEGAIKDAFARHEVADQERFEATNKGIDQLTTVVQITNGGLVDVKGKVAVIEDRAEVLTKAATDRRTSRQRIMDAVYGGAALLAVTLIGHFVAGVG